MIGLIMSGDGVIVLIMLGDGVMVLIIRRLKLL